MQTPISRPGRLDVPPKPSPATPRVVRKLKSPGSNSVTSPNPVTKTPKDRSPKVVDRKSPRTLATEKKRPNRVSELEEELKKAKEQLSSSESWKRRAQQEAEEAMRQLAATSAKLEESHKQLKELSESEEDRVQELCKISQDRDRAWQSELEAVQKQYSMDSAALASAMNEIQKLKVQLDRVSQSEASQARHAESAHAEIRSLRIELTETLVLVQKLKDQLNDSREYEAQALDEVSRARMQLEAVKNDEKRIQSECANIMESYNSLLAELEQSKSRVASLEELISRIQSDRGNCTKTSSGNGDCGDESGNLKSEVKNLKSEVEGLKSALEEAERRYRDEYIHSTMQIRNAYDLVEHAKSESCKREAELDVKIKGSTAEAEKLKIKLIEKENALQIFSCNNTEMKSKLDENQKDEVETDLELELKKSESELEDLRASLSDKEAMLISITEENEKLKSEIMKKEGERSKASDEAIELTESLKAAEEEALTKLGSLSEEADESCKKVARVTEQLDATQASNNEMETELRRLKVQCDQWRKAAEAATAMLSTGNNGKCVDYYTLGKKLSSSIHSEDSDDDSFKKKNGNMLKKIGVLLKKGQK